MNIRDFQGCAFSCLCLFLAGPGMAQTFFTNDGQGGFRDATTHEIGDPGRAFGVAVGDIDNDGDLDIFQASGGVGERPG